MILQISTVTIFKIAVANLYVMCLLLKDQSLYLIKKKKKINIIILVYEAVVTHHHPSLNPFLTHGNKS